MDIINPSGLPRLPRYLPITMLLETILVANDLAIVPIPFACTIVACAASVRALVSGTTQMQAKNDAGSVLFGCTLATVGHTPGTITTPTISAGDRIHYNLTGIGIGFADIAVTCWLQLVDS